MAHRLLKVILAVSKHALSNLHRFKNLSCSNSQFEKSRQPGKIDWITRHLSKSLIPSGRLKFRAKNQRNFTSLKDTYDWLVFPGLGKSICQVRVTVHPFKFHAGLWKPLLDRKQLYSCPFLSHMQTWGFHFTNTVINVSCITNKTWFETTQIVTFPQVQPKILTLIIITKFGKFMSIKRICRHLCFSRCGTSSNSLQPFATQTKNRETSLSSLKSFLFNQQSNLPALTGAIFSGCPWGIRVGNQCTFSMEWRKVQPLIVSLSLKSHQPVNRSARDWLRGNGMSNTSLALSWPLTF